jgi:hypothetical protein
MERRHSGEALLSGIYLNLKFPVFGVFSFESYKRLVTMDAVDTARWFSITRLVKHMVSFWGINDGVT